MESFGARDKRKLEGATKIPRYGFKVRLDHEYPEKWSQKLRPSFRESIRSLPLAWRYMSYYRQTQKKGRLPIMDFCRPLSSKQIYGAPIGGIGGGTIGRGFRGEFCRYSLVPGVYQYHTVEANCFIATIRDTDGNTLHQQVLSTSKEERRNLSCWDWSFDGKDAAYTALYPRSWTEYAIDKCRLKLVCRQISPVIPNNYKDSSLPCGVFVWEIENLSSSDIDVSITFAFQSGQGENPEGDKWNESFECDNDTVGVMIHQELRAMPCTYAVASKSRDGVAVTRMASFDPLGDGQDLWKPLSRTGHLDDRPQKATDKTTKPTGCAVCASTRVGASQRSRLEFSLVWDMPKIHFYSKIREYMRYYTTYFYDPEKSAAPEISNYCLENYASWEVEIHEWQSEVLNDPDLPDWYKSALFNELYYVADGGTVWLRSDETDHFSTNDPRKKYGRFAYLEGHEYRMYNTYDVHFYASFALSSLWPNLQASLQYEIRDNVEASDVERRTMLYSGTKAPRKTSGFVPHDVGDPCEEPFTLINAYNIHDISGWKDLNLKFVLNCYRDYVISGSVQGLRDMYQTIRDVLERSLSWDKDGDGLIENSGFPDQTYDTWIPEGPRYLASLSGAKRTSLLDSRWSLFCASSGRCVKKCAYCGSLWLSALRCATKIAEILEDTETAQRYMKILADGSEAFQDKLWNGQYYNFDSSKSEHRKAIMSDQLCGQWILQACGFGHEIFPEDRVRSALDTIYSNNVMKFREGNMGAVNSFLPTGQMDTRTIQSEEMWIGTTYGLAALMIHEGMTEKGFRTAEGAYRTVYEKIGLAFETPEALLANRIYRSIGYMRPLAIWGMQHAWKMHKNRAINEITPMPTDHTNSPE